MDYLKTIIESANNPKLIDTTQAPNENTIYHIYSDGEITQQKGSWAYGNRSEFSCYPSLDKSIPADLFPYHRNVSSGVKFGYAIVTYEDSLKIRELIKKL